VVLEENSLDVIDAGNLLEQTPDTLCLMSNLMSLLNNHGRIELEIKSEQMETESQKQKDTQFKGLEILNQFTDYFWRMGWFSHRLEIEDVIHRGGNAANPQQKNSGSTKIILRKIATTPRERTTARAMMSEFDNMPSDLETC
jgi:hypothetical protein